MKSEHAPLLTGGGMSLKGKTALVCGGTQGIGRAVAQTLAGMGARVVLLARNAERLAETAAALPGSGHQWLVGDHGNLPELKSSLAHLVQHTPIDVLINNSGGPPGGKAMNATEEAFLHAFSQHLLVNSALTQIVLPGMQKAEWGRIVNIISTSVKQPLPNLGVSNTVRAAVANWAKTLATEVAPMGITVNNVLPGATRTGRLSGLLEARAAQSGTPIETLEAEMLHEIPMKRFGEPEEIAAAVGFLCSPAAAYISGINLPVDGGRTMCL